jgi:hypothetical protein
MPCLGVAELQQLSLAGRGNAQTCHSGSEPCKHRKPRIEYSLPSGNDVLEIDQLLAGE